MNKREGRRFMWRLLTMSKVLVVPGPCDTAQANFANGLRAIGTTLWGEITESCPEQFPLMQQEAATDAEVSRQQLAKEAQDDDRRNDNGSD